MTEDTELTDPQTLLTARKASVENYLENLPAFRGGGAYTVEVDRLTGAIFVWSVARPPKILGAIFRHGPGVDHNGPPGPVWSATAADIIVARGVSREMATGCLVLALWEAGL